MHTSFLCILGLHVSYIGVSCTRDTEQFTSRIMTHDSRLTTYWYQYSMYHDIDDKNDQGDGAWGWVHVPV